ncbi:hypothetical protein M405DRAFT_809793 [Rhizopogon salebrosus TDB-379]|nr:hypothetical protein M405DRAFT_809793 [Rhizopogon salebrosus TDB-379]
MYFRCRSVIFLSSVVIITLPLRTRIHIVLLRAKPASSLHSLCILVGFLEILFYDALPIAGQIYT